MEWIKDGNESCGWRRMTHEGKHTFEGEAVDGVPPTAKEDNDVDVDVELE